MRAVLLSCLLLFVSCTKVTTPEFELLSVTPEVVEAEVASVLELDGSFPVPVTVSYRGEEPRLGSYGVRAGAVELEEVALMDGRRLRATLPAEALAPGRYDIEVRDPDGQTRVLRSALQVGSEWHAPECGRRSSIDLADPEVPLSDLNVPVLLDPSRIDYALASSEHVRFFSERELLAHEIERWDSAGQSVIWVRLVRLDAGDSTRIWLYYDCTDAASRANAWSEAYVGVWHLGESADDESTEALHFDSSPSGLDGEQEGNEAVDGRLGGAQRFDGEDDRIVVDLSALEPVTEAITLEAWARPRGFPNLFPHIIGVGGEAEGDDEGRFWQIWWDVVLQGWGGRLRTRDGPVSVSTRLGTRDGWNHVALRYDGARVALFWDGALVEEREASGELNAIEPELLIGANPELTREFEGDIDEVRISRVARSVEWLSYSYRAMNDEVQRYRQAETRPF